MQDYLKEYKLELQKVYEKSQDAFEKQLSFISAGALGFSMLFVEKVIPEFVKSKCRILIISSWLLLALTLVINLLSHHLSARNNYKTLEDIDNDEYDTDKVTGRIKIINIINLLTIISLLMGILLFIIYIVLNI